MLLLSIVNDLQWPEIAHLLPASDKSHRDTFDFLCVSFKTHNKISFNPSLSTPLMPGLFSDVFMVKVPLWCVLLRVRFTSVKKKEIIIRISVLEISLYRQKLRAEKVCVERCILPSLTTSFEDIFQHACHDRQ